MATERLQAVTEYTANPYNPEAAASFFRTIWQERAEKLKQEGVDITLPGDGYAEAELKELQADGRRPGYLPPELAMEEVRHLMVIIWPEMGNYLLKKGSEITNEENRSDWFDYEVAIDAPFRNTTEDQLIRVIEKEGRKGMNLNEYIVAAQDSKLLTGRYLDIGATVTRLLGSQEKWSQKRKRGFSTSVMRVKCADFGLSGRLRADRVATPGWRDPRLGGRSVGVPNKTLK